VKERITCFLPYVNFREKMHEDKGCTIIAMEEERGKGCQRLIE
jgi:hypothetical protein